MGQRLTKLTSKLYGHTHQVFVDEHLAYFAGLAYGDGYAGYGEIRVVTADEQYKEILKHLVTSVAGRFRGSFRTYERVSTISGRPLWNVVLVSTLLRRALFTEEMKPNYTAMGLVAFNDTLAPYFQAGLTDAEGTLMATEPIEYPHGRIIAAVNIDRRLLGIARVSLVRSIRVEPSSVKIKKHRQRGKSHIIAGQKIIARHDYWSMEILSSGKRRWLETVRVRLRHPKKAILASNLLRSFA